MSGFAITQRKGFHITFDNGWTVSVQFGKGNYADNYNHPEFLPEKDIDSTTAECAAWGPKGVMVNMPDFMYSDPNQGYEDKVSNRSTPAQVLQLLNWAASQKE